MNFGKWLFEKRKRRGYSQSELGLRSGLSGAYISMLERNYNAGRPDMRPSVETVDNLAQALEAPTAEARMFAGYCPPQSALSARTVRAMALFEALPEEFQDMVIDQLDLLNEKFGKGSAVRRVAGKKAATRRTAGKKLAERRYPDEAVNNNLQEVDHFRPTGRKSKQG